jgi:hypothetical protein
VPGFTWRPLFAREHCLPAIVNQIWQGREAAKRDQNKPLSQALKIIMNAFYGVLGSSGCRFFDPRLASSITMRGHEIMHRTRELIEEQGMPGHLRRHRLHLRLAEARTRRKKADRDRPRSGRRMSTTGGEATCGRICPGKRAGTAVRNALPALSDADHPRAPKKAARSATRA